MATHVTHIMYRNLWFWRTSPSFAVSVCLTLSCIFTDRVSREGKAIRCVCLSVCLSVSLLYVHLFPLYLLNWLTFEFEIVCVMTTACLPLKAKVIGKGQRSMFSAYGRGDAVTRSVWPRFWIEGSFISSGIVKKRIQSDAVVADAVVVDTWRLSCRFAIAHWPQSRRDASSSSSDSGRLQSSRSLRRYWRNRTGHTTATTSTRRCAAYTGSIRSNRRQISLSAFVLPKASWTAIGD